MYLVPHRNNIVLVPENRDPTTCVDSQDWVQWRPGDVLYFLLSNLVSHLKSPGRLHPLLTLSLSPVCHSPEIRSSGDGSLASRIGYTETDLVFCEPFRFLNFEVQKRGALQ